jgi:hypothetical protein
MDIETLEEYLSDFLPTGFRIDTNKKGELIVYTGLVQDDDGELSDLKAPASDESEEESEFPDEEEFEPFKDEEDEEDI